MVGKRKSNALLHIANYGIVRFSILQIITGDGRRELRRNFILRLPCITATSFGSAFGLCSQRLKTVQREQLQRIVANRRLIYIRVL